MVIGLAGGTGSGKTTLARGLVEALGAETVVWLEQDAYYRDLSHLPPADRARVNFDHPAALDVDLLAAHLRQLAAGQPIARPRYDFTTHTRRPETDRLTPRPVVLLEGHLILAEPRIRRWLDLKVFVEADPDLRFIRRLRRDLEERGRTLESILTQYLTTVRPMHQQFVEPSRRFADLILSGEGPVAAGVEQILAKLAAGP